MSDVLFEENELLVRPRYIYKYHNLNIHLIELLSNAELYLSSKNKLNDPLDSAFKINIENYLKLYIEKYPSIANNKEHLSLSQDVFKYQLENGNTDFLDNINDFQNGYNICSFTENSNNSLMWSHYTNNHSGVCLKFDLDLDNNLKKSLYPVRYLDELIEIREPSDFKKSLLVKLKDWEQEKEWRIISKKNKFNFNREALVEITFGLNVQDSTINWFKYFAENFYFHDTIINILRIKNNKLVKVDEWNKITEV